jgi:hypothetical protein
MLMFRVCNLSGLAATEMGLTRLGKFRFRDHVGPFLAGKSSVPKMPVINVGRLNKITVKLPDLVPIHLVREIEETTHTAVFYCGINTPLAAISIELLAFFPEDMICQTCLAAYRSGTPATPS